MKKSILLAVAVSLVSTGSFAAIDCRIKSMPPAKYATMNAPGYKMVGMPLIDLQKLYAGLANQRWVGGNDYCKRGPIGFVDPRGVPIIYFPSDATERCKAEVIEHEMAHIKGWPANHPNPRSTINGPCSGGHPLLGK